MDVVCFFNHVCPPAAKHLRPSSAGRLFRRRLFPPETDHKFFLMSRVIEVAIVMSCSCSRRATILILCHVCVKLIDMALMRFKLLSIVN